MESSTKVLAEMVRVTRPGGVVVIGMEPNSWFYRFRNIKHSRLGRRFMRLFRDDYTINEGPPGDMTTEGYSHGDWQKLMAGCEFESFQMYPVWYFQGVISLFKLNFLPDWVSRLFVGIDDLISKFPWIRRFSWKWLVVGRVK
jgi:hypothetical protein